MTFLQHYGQTPLSWCAIPLTPFSRHHTEAQEMCPRKESMTSAYMVGDRGCVSNKPWNKIILSVTPQLSAAHFFSFPFFLSTVHSWSSISWNSYNIELAHQLYEPHVFLFKINTDCLGFDFVKQVTNLLLCYRQKFLQVCFFNTLHFLYIWLLCGYLSRSG